MKKNRIYTLLGAIAGFVIAIGAMTMIAPQLRNVVSKPEDNSEANTDTMQQPAEEIKNLAEIDNLLYEEEQISLQPTDEDRTMKLCGISGDKIFISEEKNNPGDDPANGLDDTVDVKYYEYNRITQTKTLIFEHEVGYGYEPVCYENHMFLISEVGDTAPDCYQLYDITSEGAEVIEESTSYFYVHSIFLCGSDIVFTTREENGDVHTSCLKKYDIATKEVETIVAEEYEGTDPEHATGTTIGSVGGWGEDVVYVTYSYSYDEPGEVEARMYKYNLSLGKAEELPIESGDFCYYAGGDEQCVIVDSWTDGGEEGNYTYFETEQGYEAYRIPGEKEIGNIKFVQKMPNELLFVRNESGYTLINLEQKAYMSEKIFTPSFCNENEIAFMDEQNVLSVRKYAGT